MRELIYGLENMTNHDNLAAFHHASKRQRVSKVGSVCSVTGNTGIHGDDLMAGVIETSRTILEGVADRLAACSIPAVDRGSSGDGSRGECEENLLHPSGTVC